jgi:pimeloyl-ACP methyl ester carboxylesterase
MSGRWGLRALRYTAGLALVATTALLVAGGPAASASVATPSADYPDLSAECGVRGLQQAPVWTSDYEADGEARPGSPTGVTTPVLMVHGWTGNSTHLERPMGNFSRRGDLSTYGDTPIPTSRTLIGMLQYLGGADVYTFDYSDDSAKWVSSDRIAGGLSTALSCLAETSGQEVIVIAHSMGGLALRQVLGDRPELRDDISQVITFGTPNTGSDMALAASTGIDRARFTGGTAEVRAIAFLTSQALTACGTASTVRLATGGLCDVLPAPARAFRSEAGLALQSGSVQLQALAPWPEGLPVHALAGDTALTIPRAGFLGLSFSSEDVRMGDLVVGDDSATDGSTTQDYARCRYTMSAVHGIGEDLLTGMRLITKDEAGRNLFELAGVVNDAATPSPCFHGALMRTQKLVVAMQSYVIDDIDARAREVPDSVGSTALVRLDPWSDPRTVAEAGPTEGFITGCSAESTLHPEALSCATSAKCIASPDGTEALCPSVDVQSWSRVRVERSEYDFESPELRPFRLRLVDGSSCAFSTGAGPFPPEGFETWAGGCRRTDGEYDVLWSDPIDDVDTRLLDWLFLTEDPDGYLRVGVGPENEPVEYVGVETIYY